MKKKLVALILIGSMALSFTACGNSSDSSKGTKEASKKTEASAETPKEEAKEEVKILLCLLENGNIKTMTVLGCRQILQRIPSQ